MKKILMIVLSFVFTCFAGCSSNVPVREVLTDYGDGSTVYMPVVETGNVALDKSANEEIKNRLTANYMEIKKDKAGKTTEGFTAYQTGDLLSVFHEGYFEEEGKEGNGISYIYSLHINIKNGTFYKLDDLFLPDYQDELSSLVADVLDSQLGEYSMAYRPDIKNAAFDVYGKEIIFIFDPGVVAPDNMGFVDGAVPFERLDHLLNKESEFYQVVVSVDE